jgi:hypothetical protein
MEERLDMICKYCGYDSENEVHEYTDQGQIIKACDDIEACIKREVENKKELIRTNVR